MRWRVSIPRLLRRRRAPVGAAGGGGEAAGWVGGQQRLATAMRWGVWASLGSGVVALVLVVSGAVSPTPAVVTQRSGQVVDMAQQAAAGDLAQQFVLAWLQGKRGEEKALAVFVRSDGIRLPVEQEFVATDPAVASVASMTRPAAAGGGGSVSPSSSVAPTSGSDPAVWSVVVSVSVRGVREPVAATTRRYFQVPVVFTGTAVRAAALPAAVPAPRVGPDVALGYRARVGSDHPVSVAAGQFLSALVAGQGDISRYTSPSTAIAAISPPPYRGVTLLEVVSDTDLSAGVGAAPAEGDTIRVLATAALDTGGGTAAAITGQYALTLTARGGRWEVSVLDPVPLLPSRSSRAATETAPGTSATSSPATATTTTTVQVSPIPGTN